MLKERIFRYMAFFCAAVILTSSFSFKIVSADEPVGKMSSVFAYTLNDYIFTYGAMGTDNPGDIMTIDGSEYPKGVVYSEIINFDDNDNPYLAIFLADDEYTVASCHMWKYDEKTEKAERIAILDVNYSLLTDGRVGTFSIGFNNEKRYIIYKEYENDILSKTDYYTAIEGDAFQYVNAPPVVSEIGVMDFSSSYFHSNVDISNYNVMLGNFFDSLKNTAADSVTYEDIAERLSPADETQIEAVLKNVTGLTDFDIAEYSSMTDYEEAIAMLPEGDRFYLISEAYNLGDEIYYIRFSTERSYYNYALLRRSDDAENGYQILKVRTDCIPLSDRELKQIKTDYDRNTLLYKKTKEPLKLERKRAEEDSTMPSKKPVIDIDKRINIETRLPAVCVGGGIAVALLTILWVYLYSDND